MRSISTLILVLLCSAALVALLAYMLDRNNTSPSLRMSPDPEETFQGPRTPEEQRINSPAAVNTMNPKAIITTNHGVITLELFADQMPITVGNFVELSQSGYYDGTKFHRIIPGFMVQGGDPNTKTANEATYGTGGPGYTIRDEFVTGELLTNTRGTIAMANTGQPNSGGSQFFINLVDNTGLDFDKEPASSKHPVFGRVVDGMDVVDAIARVETSDRDLPLEAVVIESIEITEG